MPPTIEVLQPTSPDEAVEAFGDGDGVTVIAGGTIVLPDLTFGRLRPSRAIMIGAAGLDGGGREDGVLRYGATTPISALDEAPAPLRQAAAHVADREIRAAGTIGGNLCAGQPASGSAPRGDLQAPLIALAATVRSAGAGGERTEPVEDFLASGGNRLVLSIDIPDVPRRSGYARLDRPHAHHYTMLAVSVVAPADGLDGVRVVVSGAGPGQCAAAQSSGRSPPAIRMPPTACSTTSSPSTTRSPPPGTASACCPRSCPAPSTTCTEEREMHIVVNGVDHEIESGPLTPLLQVLREEIGLTSPKAGCQQGGCGTCTVLVDGEPRRACLTRGRRDRGLRGHHGRGALGSTDDLHPVQQAFNDLYAAQCGFCTPGLMLATVALLDREPVAVARGHRRGARRPHLPLYGLRQDPRRRRGPLARGCAMKAVGARLPRYDGLAHVTGRTLYVDDVRVPGMLWCKGLRSPHDSARIVRIDTSRAEQAARRARGRAARRHADEHRRPPGGARRAGRRAVPRRRRGALPRPADRRRGGRGRGHRARGGRA